MKRSLYPLFVIAFALICETVIAQQARKTVGNTRSRLATEQMQQLQGTISGTISIVDPDVLQQLQQGWNANISQAVGTQIKVELWQVNYVPDKKDNLYTNILLVQKLDANVSYQVAQNTIQYSANYRPVAGNVVAIAYTSIVLNTSTRTTLNARARSSDKPVIKFSGKPNDGTPASLGHQFRSDAKKHLGNNIIYGIYSLPSRSGNFSTADFRVASSVKNPNCNNCDFIGDAWNAVSDAADDVANFVKATVNGTGDALANLGESIIVDNGSIGVECFGVIATFLQTGDTPQARMLSDSHYGNAYNIANSTIFMNTLPPPDRIIVTNLMTVDKRMFTIPIKTGNTVFILLNMGKGYDDPLNYNRNGFNGDVFIHELTHAWQIWHNNLLMLFADGAVNQFKNTVISNQYNYSCDGHNLTESYNEEQQAMIVENFYSAMFFRPDLLTKTRTSVPCGFEQQWVVQNILGNQPANMDARFTATEQIIMASSDKTLVGYTGGVIDHAIASPSNGNRLDGAGYFLPGKINNSFFYYSNKTKVTSANWGPVRDEFIKAGYEFGELGWPEMNETLLPDRVGFFQKFDHGYIYWSPKYGAHVVPNRVFGAWAATGWEKGQLGYPIADYVTENAPKTNNRFTETAEKGYQKFANGVIFYALPAVIAAARENQNYTTVEVGDPDKIITMHNITSTGPRQSENAVANQQQQQNKGTQQSGTTVRRASDAVEINPQPLPPKVAKTELGSTSEAAKVQINPQPLPPKTVKSATAENVQAAKVQINPQPLPPKTVKRSAATIHQPKAEINPQPLPPKN